MFKGERKLDLNAAPSRMEAASHMGLFKSKLIKIK